MQVTILFFLSISVLNPFERLLYVLIIPIDFKITNFSLYYTCLFTLMVTIIVLSNSQAPLQRKNGHKDYVCRSNTH